MGKFTFDDDEEQEPTFSLADFRKWLAKQGKPDEELKSESVEEVTKEELKEKFKENFKEKLRTRRKKKS